MGVATPDVTVHSLSQREGAGGGQVVGIATFPPPNLSPLGEGAERLHVRIRGKGLLGPLLELLVA